MSVYILSTSERITLFWQRFLSGIGFYIPHFWTAFFTPTFHSLFDRRLHKSCIIWTFQLYTIEKRLLIHELSPFGELLLL